MLSPVRVKVNFNMTIYASMTGCTSVAGGSEGDELGISFPDSVIQGNTQQFSDSMPQDSLDLAQGLLLLYYNTGINYRAAVLTYSSSRFSR